MEEQGHFTILETFIKITYCIVSATMDLGDTGVSLVDHRGDKLDEWLSKLSIISSQGLENKFMCIKIGETRRLLEKIRQTMQPSKAQSSETLHSPPMLGLILTTELRHIHTIVGLSELH